MIRATTLACVLFLFVSCGGGSGGGGGGNGEDPPGTTEPTPFVLAAGPVGLAPVASGGESWVSESKASRVRLERVDAAYDLTTPAGEPFAFDLIARSEGNAGHVQIALAHADDGGTTPDGDATTMAEAGLVASASGTRVEGVQLVAEGDGFTRMTIRGKVERDQVLAVQADSGKTAGTSVLVRIRVGPESPINVVTDPKSDDPGVVDDETIYSSDSWMFGLPTIAVSGDRTSIVCYEGDRGLSRSDDRYEMRLQFDAATGIVTGGGSEETGLDSGNWRDHEIAALYNTLALVRSGRNTIDLWLSFDRGATFGQKLELPVGPVALPARLAQVAMALDYSLAVLYWRTGENDASELVLVEGRPSAFDGGGSPAAYVLDPPVVVHEAPGDVTPLLMSAVWSDGGDLVIGYGYSSFTRGPDWTWESRTENRCAVRLWQSEIVDGLVEEDVVVGRDPSVSVVGSGSTMLIFYAYEGRDGVRLRTSEDAGGTWSEPRTLPDPTAHTPTVIARTTPSATRVDVLYLAAGKSGQELYRASWDDYGAKEPVVHRLTEAVMTLAAELPPDAPIPGGEYWDVLPTSGYRVTEVAWFGYDAVVDGDEIVVAIDEATYDAWLAFGMPERFGGPPAPTSGSTDAGVEFDPAEPPPLAPGMTESVEEPDPDHMHQLRLLRIE